MDQKVFFIPAQVSASGLCVFYLFTLHSITYPKTCHFIVRFAYYEGFLMFSILILLVTSSRFRLYLLNIDQFTYTCSQTIQWYAHTITQVQSAHPGLATTRYRSLVERGGRQAFARDIGPYTNMGQKQTAWENQSIQGKI